jgi:hypothetical protein
MLERSDKGNCHNDHGNRALQVEPSQFANRLSLGGVHLITTCITILENHSIKEYPNKPIDF